MDILMQLNSFILIFVRTASMIFFIPFLGARNVPRVFKIGLALLISLILISIVKIDATIISADLLTLTAGIAGEIIIGFTIGLISKLVFSAMEMAGEIIGFQMGFSIVNVIDPQTSTHVPIIGQFHTILATLIFLTINAHHLFIAAIAESFTLVPPMRLALTNQMFAGIMTLSRDIFVLAIRIGAPVIVALFITNIALAIVSKTMPQMNVMMVGFPITIAGGLLIMVLSLPLFANLVQRAFEGMKGDFFNILSVMVR
ncbi:MAG: flagellar biosynthetic protein FliR [Nitrospirae bacterium RBG_16_43_11]|nr:MAG: flagellar biosynthetic protein FliR [Nitrospirae bacterium RBG_16_43_11]